MKIVPSRSVDRKSFTRLNLKTRDNDLGILIEEAIKLRDFMQNERRKDKKIEN